MTDRPHSRKSGEDASPTSDQGKNHDRRQSISKLIDKIDKKNAADRNSSNVGKDAKVDGRPPSLRELLGLPSSKAGDHRRAPEADRRDSHGAKYHDALGQLAATIADGDRTAQRDREVVKPPTGGERAGRVRDGQNSLGATDLGRQGMPAVTDTRTSKRGGPLDTPRRDARDGKMDQPGTRTESRNEPSSGLRHHGDVGHRHTFNRLNDSASGGDGPSPRFERTQPTELNSSRNAEQKHEPESSHLNNERVRERSRADQSRGSEGRADATRPTVQEFLRSLRGDAPNVAADRALRVSTPGVEGFSTGRADLLPGQFERLERAISPTDGTKLYGNKDLTIMIAASASALGDAESNQALSDERAQAVKQEFVARGYVGEFLVLSKGEGKRDRGDRSDNPYDRVVGVSLDLGVPDANYATGKMPDVSPPRVIERDEAGLIEGVANLGVEHFGSEFIAKEIVGHVAEKSLGFILEIAKFQLEGLTQLGDAGAWRSKTYIDAFAESYAQLTAKEDQPELIKQIQDSPFERLSRDQIESMRDVRASDGQAVILFKDAIEASARHDALDALMRLGKDEVQAFSRQHPEWKERYEIIAHHLREHAVRH